MKFCLASRYDDRLQLCAIRDRLLAQGHEVTARWLNGSHEMHEGADSVAESRRFAEEDLCDVEACDIFVLFNNPSALETIRGGRHIEFGYAFVRGRLCVIVGQKLSVFHHLDGVWQYRDWEAFLERSVGFHSLVSAYRILECATPC